ncbi:MAG: hypothetical protein JKY88_17780 [Pseudomonadales bacterium]|nr:hypothetical protein [Pseudomonadales bacterium]
MDLEIGGKLVMVLMVEIILNKDDVKPILTMTERIPVILKYSGLYQMYSVVVESANRYTMVSVVWSVIIPPSITNSKYSDG